MRSFMCDSYCVIIYPTVFRGQMTLLMLMRNYVMSRYTNMARMSDSDDLEYGRSRNERSEMGFDQKYALEYSRYRIIRSMNY